MKTKEELNAIKEEMETLNKKLCELTEDELSQVVGGFVVDGKGEQQEIHIYKNGIQKEF